MAVTSSTSQVSYTGNNSAVTAYPVPFLFYNNSDLVVTVLDSGGITTTLGSGDYIVTGAGVTSGGNVTTAIAYDNTNTLTIARVLPATQLFVFTENDKFQAKTFEKSLDNAIMLVQQLLRMFGGNDLSNIPTSDPHVLGAFYKSGDFIAVSNG